MKNNNGLVYAKFYRKAPYFIAKKNMVSCGLSLKPINPVKNGEQKTSASPGIFPAAVNGWSHWGDKPLADLRASAVNFKFWQFSCDRKNGNIIRNRCVFVGFDATISTILVSGFPYCQIRSVPDGSLSPSPGVDAAAFKGLLAKSRMFFCWSSLIWINFLRVEKNDQLTRGFAFGGCWNVMPQHATMSCHNMPQLAGKCW